MTLSRRFYGIHGLATIAVVLAVMCAIALVYPVIAHAAPIYVSAFGSDAAGDGYSAPTAFATVQHAIDVGASGDVVQVGAGTFIGDITLKDGVSLQGAGSTNTTLTGSGTNAVLSASNVTSATSITGLTVTGGHGWYGGGIALVSSSPTISKCKVVGNAADQRGGGIYCNASSPTVTDCTISANTAGGLGGGGVYALSSSVTLADCLIKGNGTTLQGGGVLCDSSSVTLDGCTLTANSSGTGGGAVFGPANLTDCTLSGNSSGGYGGALYGPSVVESCTIANNVAQAGGGVYGGAALTSDTIVGNSSTGGGGGIFLQQDSLTITRCIVRGNTAGGYGGGISMWQSSPTITNSTVADNIQNDAIGEGGGGICLGGFCSPTIVNCIISGNTAAGNGGGIYSRYYSAPTITNCTLTRNTSAGQGVDVFSDGIGLVPAIKNCIIWDDGNDLVGCSATYSDVKAPAVGTNINADPCFIDAAHGDFHLSAASPSIDSGTLKGAPSTDKDGNPRPVGAGFDMGAYEFARDIFRLSYLADPNGTIGGTPAQRVEQNGSGTSVTASPETGYRFVKWSDGSTVNPRTDANVTADATYTAAFAIDTHTLHYSAGPGGSIDGSATQTLDYGAGGSSVTAIQAKGYHFVKWSDGSTATPRTDTNVTADKSVSAVFALTTYTQSTTTKLAGYSSSKLKKTYKLTGTVRSSAAPGKVTITMTRYSGGKWRSMGHVHANVSRGAFSYSFKPKYKGSWRFVASYSGGVVGVTTYKASNSGVKTVKVK
jgi:parallel beta-helix repeat protein/predicted outer membrane repeat protein